MNGVVNVLKPTGLTSRDLATDVGRIFSTKKTGHTGTLDPGASGVLPVCLGKATRLFDFLLDKEKEYIAGIAFGIETDTQDAYGKIVGRIDCDVSAGQLSAVLPEFSGEFDQTAPGYSALNVNGQKMYKIARAGGEIPQKIRSITVSSIELVDKPAKNSFLIRLRCSKGTYLRTICHDIGKKLGVCAHMSFLLRTASGGFALDGAWTLEELRELEKEERLNEAVTPMDQAVGHIRRIELSGLSGQEYIRLINGADIELPACNAAEDGDALLFCGGFIGIGRIKENRAAIRINLMEDNDA